MAAISRVAFSESRSLPAMRPPPTLPKAPSLPARDVAATAGVSPPPSPPPAEPSASRVPRLDRSRDAGSTMQQSSSSGDLLGRSGSGECVDRAEDQRWLAQAEENRERLRLRKAAEASLAARRLSAAKAKAKSLEAASPAGVDTGVGAAGTSRVGRISSERADEAGREPSAKPRTSAASKGAESNWRARLDDAVTRVKAARPVAPPVEEDPAATVTALAQWQGSHPFA